VPGFSLFRRSSSRTANPTTQGVTLRNFGPSGAGRTLVLLDGIPLNDPFAGYVLWSQVPPALLESVLVQPGGGAGLFGNAGTRGHDLPRSAAY
jgi:outer membrane receptor protein involved in Fe transport